MRRVSVMILLAALLLPALGASAQKVEEISGEYTYYGTAHDSPAECLKRAEEGAIIEALRSKYGTIVTQSLVQTDRIKDGRETNDFMMLSSSEVNGQWLGHTAEPKKEVAFDKDGALVATVKVKGRAMRFSTAATQYEAIAMRNGTGRTRFADTRFRAGDTLYSYFCAPIDGYLTAFLADEAGNVFCIFPYTTSPDGAAKMKGGYEYVLFDETRADSGFGQADGMVMTADASTEYNKLFFLYSPQEYTLPPMRNAGTTADGLQLPKMTDYKSFTQWLARLRAADPKLGVKMINLTITN